MDSELGNVSLSGGGSASEPKSHQMHQMPQGMPQTSSQMAAQAQQAAASFTQQAAHQAAESTAQQAVQNVTGGAARALRSSAAEVRLYIVSNPYSVTVLSFFGGAVLSIVSFLGLFNIFGALLGPLSYILQVYQLMFGLMICAIDGPSDRLPHLRAAVMNYASFLHNNTSRAMFYLFIACMEGTQQSVFHEIVGWYFLCIAVGHGVLRAASPQIAGPGVSTQELLEQNKM